MLSEIVHDPKMVHVFGEVSTGKTSVALHLAALAVSLGIPTLYVDWYHCLTPDFLATFGLSLNDPLLDILFPLTQVEGVAGALEAAKNGTRLIVLDGVGATMIGTEDLDSADHKPMGAFWNETLLLLTDLADKGVSIIFVQPTRGLTNYGGFSQESENLFTYLCPLRIQLLKATHVSRSEAVTERLSEIPNDRDVLSIRFVMWHNGEQMCGTFEVPPLGGAELVGR